MCESRGGESPDLPAEKVLERLRRHEATAAIPVVAISAEAGEDAIERMRAAGASGYIVKPIRIEKLLETVDGIAAEETVVGEEAI